MAHIARIIPADTNVLHDDKEKGLLETRGQIADKVPAPSGDFSFIMRHMLREHADKQTALEFVSIEELVPKDRKLPAVNRHPILTVSGRTIMTHFS